MLWGVYMADKCLSQVMMEAEVLPGDSVGFAMSRGVLLYAYICTSPPPPKILGQKPEVKTLLPKCKHSHMGASTLTEVLALLPGY